MPIALASRSSLSKFGTISAQTYLRRSPISPGVPTYGELLSSASSGCGAMFFPYALMMMSFLRSVIFRNPSLSSSPISPVRQHPSASIACAVRAAREDLAVRGDLHLDALDDFPDRADLARRRRVRADHRRRLGQSIAL